MRWEAFGVSSWEQIKWKKCKCFVFLDEEMCSDGSSSGLMDRFWKTVWTFYSLDSSTADKNQVNWLINGTLACGSRSHAHCFVLIFLVISLPTAGSVPFPRSHTMTVIYLLCRWAHSNEQRCVCEHKPLEIKAAGCDSLGHKWSSCTINTPLLLQMQPHTRLPFIFPMVFVSVIILFSILKNWWLAGR